MTAAFQPHLGRMPLFCFMQTKRRYYLLKRNDGWHVMQETRYEPPVEISDAVGRPMDKAQAEALLKDFDKNARPEELRN